MALDEKIIELEIGGLGIIFYSPSMLPPISEGTNYLRSHYSTSKQIEDHIQNGSLASFGTGSPGRYILQIMLEGPNEEELRENTFHLCLNLHCKGRTVCFRDLYDLIDWEDTCPSKQTMELNEGYYKVTLLTRIPVSGLLGDNQIIKVFFQKVESLSKIKMAGFPILCQ